MAAGDFSLMFVLMVAIAMAARIDMVADTGRDSESAATTWERFASAFPEIHADSSCPYGDEEKAKSGGVTSFDCHWKSEGMGSSCPDLQATRLKAVRTFQAKNYASFLDGVSGYPLSPLFDKSAHVKGDETYEQMDKLQIQGLMHPEVINLEDKINLKKLAKSLGVPTTTMYFSAHENDWDRELFKKSLGKICTMGIDGFFIKATHLAWSKGQYLVKDFQKDCQQKTSSDRISEELAKFIEESILSVKASVADAHLREYLTPGVTVESLFKTGGLSTQPLEAKVQVLWGKVHHMFLIGTDNRGCRVNGGSWQIYGDKTGWDLAGMIKPTGGNDALGDRLLEKAFQPMVDYAERFARGVRADLMRVDFFIGIPDKADGEWLIQMNECESVSGHPYWHERHGLGAIWRDGYVLSNRVAMTPKTWSSIVKETQADRDALGLD